MMMWVRHWPTMKGFLGKMFVARSVKSVIPSKSSWVVEVNIGCAKWWWRALQSRYCKGF